MLLRTEKLVNLLEQLSAGFAFSSNTATCIPRFAASMAADNPAGPAPTIKKSYRFMMSALPLSKTYGCLENGSADTPYCVCTCIPASNGVTHVLTLGFPFTIMTQSVQRPIAQKIPRG